MHKTTREAIGWAWVATFGVGAIALILGLPTLLDRGLWAALGAVFALVLLYLIAYGFAAWADRG